MNVEKNKNIAMRDVNLVDFTDINLNEEEDHDLFRKADESADEEQGNPEDFIDVLDILDGHGELESGNEAQWGAQDARKVDLVDLQNDKEDEDEEDEEQGIRYGHSLPVFDQEGSSALQDLTTFIRNLDRSRKRKAPGSDSPSVHADDNRGQKRRLTKEYTQVGQESETAAQPGVPFLTVLVQSGSHFYRKP
jgi:U3 small nucleolar RNA-associated protein 14